MKAITLHQPYASLIASGTKTLETRTWATSHRGPLLICAAKRKAKPDIRPIVDHPTPWDELPRGVALCIVDVVDCRPMLKADEQAACCPIYPNAKVWQLANLRPVKPFAVKGMQSIFNVDYQETP